MTRTKHDLTITLPIPATIPPPKLLEAIHSHTPLFRAQAYVTSVRPAPTDPSAVLEDPFFVESGLKIRSYAIAEQVPVLPAGLWSAEVTFTAVCQNVEDGARVKADAPAGVVVRSVYHVRPSDGARGGYELSSTTSVECHVLLMPFVSRSMEGAHRELCRKVLDEVEREVAGAAAAHGRVEGC